MGASVPLQRIPLPDLSLYASMLPYAYSQELLNQFIYSWRGQADFRTDVAPSSESPSVVSPPNLSQESELLL